MKLDYETPRIDDRLAERLAGRSFLSIRSGIAAATIIGVAFIWATVFDGPSSKYEGITKFLGVFALLGGVVLIPVSIYQGFVSTCSTDPAVRRRGTIGMLIGGLLAGGVLLASSLA